MPIDPTEGACVRVARTAREEPRREATRTWLERPRFEVIPLDCEITAYAPDGDLPLF